MTEPTDLPIGFVPEWPLPANVHAFVTTRYGGNSAGSYTSNNLALHVGDHPQTVEKNRDQLLNHLRSFVPNHPTVPDLPTSQQNNTNAVLSFQWLRQVHGDRVVQASGSTVEADGCISDQPLLVCTVMTADCVPILMCDRNGQQVAAVHAGWRGLAQGIIAKAVQRFKAAPADLTAYIGPAICQQCYEVNTGVRDALLNTLNRSALVKCDHSQYDQPVVNKHGHYLISLSAIAAAQLQQIGVTSIYGGDVCNSCDPRFYSYRRERQTNSTDQTSVDTGRFASLIWRQY